MTSSAPTASPYVPDFFERRSLGSSRSAAAIVPLVMEIVQPSSVIDLGCGIGDWLEVFADSGVRDIFGIDGAWVRPDMLRIPHTSFRPGDAGQPLALDREFDLSVSLETGEHLPSAQARTLVASLVSLAPVVLFSAAVPGQGGVDHVNEQWPSWWAALFREHGYRCHDVLREQVWGNPDIDWWYAQNAMLYTSPDAALDLPCVSSPLDLVHPRLYARTRRAAESPQFGTLVKLAPKAAARAVRKRLSL